MKLKSFFTKQATLHRVYFCQNAKYYSHRFKSPTRIWMELCNFDSEILMTAALDWQAIRRSSSILSKRLFMLMWVIWNPRVLRTSHSLSLEGWSIWGGPEFKLISPESNSSDLKKVSSKTCKECFYYLLFISKKHTNQNDGKWWRI